MFIFRIILEYNRDTKKWIAKNWNKLCNQKKNNTNQW